MGTKPIKSRAWRNTAADLDTIEAGRSVGRALASATPEARRLTLARSFGCRVVVAWWQALTEADGGRAPLRPPLQAFPMEPLPDPAAAVADSIGTACAALDPEAAAYRIGLAYTGMLPPEHRGTYGIYYTPPALAARLIEQATEAGVDWTTARVLDPACGGGAFLAPVSRRIMAALPDCAPAFLIRTIGNRLRGHEIDPFAAWLSQVALDALLLPATRATGTCLPVVVEICDSLRRPPSPDRFDLVIGNPPYGRVTLAAEERERFRRSLFGHANLYGLFTDLALQHAGADGVIAYVTPTSFLAGEYFKKLRSLLGRCAPPVTIDFISVRRGIFDDVLQETLLATYRCDAAVRPVRVSEVTPADADGLVAAPAGTTALPDDRSQPWLLPRTPSQTHLLQTMTGMPHRLADWGYGVSTGPLVWNRFKSQLSHRPGPHRHPLIWAEAVTPDGRFVFRAEKKNHAPYFEIRPGDEWLTAHEPCVLLQRTTAKEQARRLIAAALPPAFLYEHGGVVIENHLNMIRATTDDPVISADVLAAFLNSAAADRVFRCVSGSVAVSAYEVEAMPLPAPESLSSLAGLVRAGAPRSAIEATCLQLYAEAADR